MGILNEIDRSRRNVMRKITQNIGTSDFGITIDPSAAIEVKRILISRPNDRLGNLLLITPLLQEVIAAFPDCKIDLFVRGGVATTLFKNYTNVDRIIQLPKKPFKNLLKYIGGWLALKKKRYDIVINVVKYSSSGRLSSQFATSKYKFFGSEDEEMRSEHSDYQHIAKNAVYSFRNYLSRLRLKKSSRPAPFLDLRLTQDEIAEGGHLLQELVKNDKKTICIFTYATGRKRYSEEWWLAFYERLLNEYPGYNIVEVLPIENVSQIGFKAPSFYSKNVRELGAFIANTQIFIGADSGVMHLASAVNTPTVGLFSVSNPKVYEPYNANSVAINTNAGDVNSWMEVVNRILRIDEINS